MILRANSKQMMRNNKQKCKSFLHQATDTYNRNTISLEILYIIKMINHPFETIPFKSPVSQYIPTINPGTQEQEALLSLNHLNSLNQGLHLQNYNKTVTRKDFRSHYHKNQKVEVVKQQQKGIYQAAKYQTMKFKDKQLELNQIFKLFSVYVSRGNGWKIVSDISRTYIKPKRYGVLISAVMRSTLKQFGNLISSSFGGNIKPFSQEEIHLLQSPMVYCATWLTQDEKFTFNKLINLVYSQNNEPIFHDELLALYKKVYNQLLKRKVQKRQNNVKKQAKVKTYPSETKAKLQFVASENLHNNVNMPANNSTFILNHSIITQNYYQRDIQQKHQNLQDILNNNNQQKNDSPAISKGVKQQLKFLKGQKRSQI